MPTEIEVKTILNKTKRRDPWFLDDYTLNPYSGCSFNCLYCYIRSSRYGTHMEKSLSVKINAPELLEIELRKRAERKEYGFIVLSSATDPYLKAEKNYELTRKLLQIILEYRFPVHVVTKSDLVVRDIDLLKEIDKRAILPFELENGLSGGTIVTFSFSTINSEIAKIFEPNAPSPLVRLDAMKTILLHGFNSGVNLMPLIPFISDSKEQLHNAFQMFSNLGVKYILPSTLTLFGDDKSDSKAMTFKAIQMHYPHLLEKYEKLFSKSHQLPGFYRKEFHEKIRELHALYKIPQKILNEEHVY